MKPQDPTEPTKEYYDDVLYNYRDEMQKRYEAALAKYQELVDYAATTQTDKKRTEPFQRKIFNPDSSAYTSSFSLSTMGLKGITISASGGTVSFTGVCETARGIKCGAWVLYSAPSLVTMVTKMNEEQARAVLATMYAQHNALRGSEDEAAAVRTALDGFVGYFI